MKGKSWTKALFCPWFESTVTHSMGKLNLAQALAPKTVHSAESNTMMTNASKDVAVSTCLKKGQI